MSKKVELNVNGILTLPGDAEGWTDRACTLGHLERGVCAEKLENFTGVMTRMFRQDRKARLVAKVARKYLEAGWEVYLRGHSNGCDIILRALRIIQGFTTEAAATVAGAQFIAPAAEADFDRNGLNDLLRRERPVLEKLVVCWGPNDWALAAARVTHPILNLFGNGFGSMGLTGPQNVAGAVWERVISIEDRTFGHSDWLAKENISATLDLMDATRNEARHVRGRGMNHGQSPQAYARGYGARSASAAT